MPTETSIKAPPRLEEIVVPEDLQKAEEIFRELKQRNDDLVLVRDKINGSFGCIPVDAPVLHLCVSRSMNYVQGKFPLDGGPSTTIIHTSRSPTRIVDDNKLPVRLYRVIYS